MKILIKHRFRHFLLSIAKVIKMICGHHRSIITTCYQNIRVIQLKLEMLRQMDNRCFIKLKPDQQNHLEGLELLYQDLLKLLIRDRVEGSFRTKETAIPLTNLKELVIKEEYLVSRLQIRQIHILEIAHTEVHNMHSERERA